MGDAEMLGKFLELNPSIPPEQMFVDDYSFAAYNSVTLGSMKDVNAFDSEQMKNVKLSAPRLDGIRGWWKYLSNVGALSPVEKGTSGVPEGVFRLGGAFVVRGDEVVYVWRERTPGDHPDLEQVMLAVEGKLLFSS